MCLVAYQRKVQEVIVTHTVTLVHGISSLPCEAR
jgi:hypothetical protein